MKNSIAKASLKVIAKENKELRSQILETLKLHVPNKETPLHGWIFGTKGASFISHLQEVLVCITLRHTRCTKPVKHSYEFMTEEECKRAIKFINDKKFISLIKTEFDIALRMSLNGKYVVIEYSEAA